MDYTNEQGKHEHKQNPKIIFQTLPAQEYGPDESNKAGECFNMIKSILGAHQFDRAIGAGAFSADMVGIKSLPSKKKKRARGSLQPQAHEKQWQATRIKRHLSRKNRKDNDLLKLPRTGWNYDALQPMHQMWLAYMDDCFGKLLLQEPTIKNSPVAEAAFHSCLAKCDLVGAYITVIRSKVPNYVDLAGIIVLETKQTFQIVTPKNEFKILMKAPSVFAIRVRQLTLTIFGEALLMRPHERCVKKIKSYLKLDL